MRSELSSTGSVGSPDRPGRVCRHGARSRLNFLNFSERNALLLLVALVAGYLLILLLRLAWLGGQRLLQRLGRKWQDWRLTRHQHRPRPQWARALDMARPVETTEPAAAPSASASSAPSASFEAHLFRRSIEHEMQQLRTEVNELRELIGQLKSSRSTSPQYSEAMRLARRGANARTIADECAISLGEAELVLAMSRDRQDYEDHDNRYDENY